MRAFFFITLALVPSLCLAQDATSFWQEIQNSTAIKQLEEAQQTLTTVNEHLEKFNQYLGIVGDPASVVDVVGADIGMDTSSLDALGNFMDTAQGTYQAGQTLMSNAQNIPNGVNLSGGNFAPDNLLATMFNKLRTVRKQDEKIQKDTKAENDRLKQKLKSATTQAEVDKINAAIAANEATARQSSEYVAKKEAEYQSAASQYQAEQALEAKANNEAAKQAMEKIDSAQKQQKYPEIKKSGGTSAKIKIPEYGGM